MKEPDARTRRPRQVHQKAAQSAGTPTLDELAETPDKASALAPNVAAELLARCLAVQGVLVARLLSGAMNEPPSSPAGEPLMTMPQVGAALAVPVSYAEFPESLLTDFLEPTPAKRDGPQDCRTE